jgi:serine/threonine protein kinase/tetratricopeptide (TPR) repeat protein
MNNRTLDDSSCWQPMLAMRIEEVCIRYEAARKAGERPRIESYVADAEEPERSVLLGELLALELEYCLKRGEDLTPEDYERQFPQHLELIREVFRDVTPRAREIDQVTPSEPADLQMSQPLAFSNGTGLTYPTQPEVVTPPTLENDYSLPTVPGYEILGILGRGGMGIVYKARQKQLDRLVALKMIPSSAEPQERTRFRNEANAVARLQHPNIVHIYEVSEREGLPYFSLEYVDSGSLKDLLASAPLPADQAATLVEIIARAMHFAHERGIIHRDLKPANILLQKSEIRNSKLERPGSPDLGFRISDFLPKIADFGLAKRLDDDSGQTRSGALMGTPSYMAPEQAAGKNRTVGPAADVYALGAVLYETLTGRPPFRAATFFETVEQVCTEEPLPPSRLQPKVPRDLETICLACLEKEPHKRYASAQALADDLRRFLSSEPIHARPTPSLERAIKWAKRRPAAAVAATVSVAALFGLFIGVLSYTKLQAEKDKIALVQRIDEEESRGRFLEQISVARQALASKRWADARPALARAQQILVDHPTLEDLREQLERLQTENELGSAEELGKVNAEADYRHFFECHKRALLRGTLFTGVDLPTNLDATRAAITDALDVLQISVDHPKLPDSTYFTEKQKAELTTGCYELLLILAESLAQDKPPQFERARVVLDQATQLRPPTKAYYLRRARYLAQLGDKNGAEKAEVLAKNSGAVGAFDHFLMGEDFYRQGKLQSAIGEFEAALQWQADHFWACYYLAVSYLTLPQPIARSAKECLTACLKEQPELPWLYIWRGVAYGQLQQYEAAEKDFEKVMSLKPGVSKEARYSALVNRGVLRLNQSTVALRAISALYFPGPRAAKRLSQKILEPAESDFRQAIQVQPEQYQAYMSLAKVYQQQNNLDAALTQLDKAIKIALPPVKSGDLDTSALIRLYLNMGDVHYQGNDLDAALEDLGQAIAIGRPEGKSPILAEVHAARGSILYKAKKHKNAVAEYDAALKIRPNAADVYRYRAEALVDWGLAEAPGNSRRQHFEDADRSFYDYLRHGGKPSAKFYKARGENHARIHEYAQAIADYTDALALKPDSDTFAARGWAKIVLHAHKEALDDFQKAIQLNAKNGDAYNGRGFALAKLVQWSFAVSDADKAVDLGPKNQRHLWSAARIFAEIVRQMDSKQEQKRMSAPGTRFAYQTRAIQLLREALELTPAKERASFWRTKIEENEDFRAIRYGLYGELRVQFAGPAK